MRLSFSTLTQASRADGSVARMRSVVTRSDSFSSGAPSTVSSATVTIGLDRNLRRQHPISRRGGLTSGLKRRRQATLRGSRFIRSERAVSLTWSGWVRSKASWAAVG